jgi:sarcosine oxidase
MGHSVTLIDQYGPGNARATSGGESRQIRAVYGEREIYTRWVLQAFDRWQAREAEWGKKLFYRTGQLSLAPQWTKELLETRKVFDRLGV